jgi:hypothetical protein
MYWEYGSSGRRLLCKHEALNSTPSSTKTKQNKTKNPKTQESPTEFAEGLLYLQPSFTACSKGKIYLLCAGGPNL